MSYTAYMTAAVSEKILLFEMDILEESAFINSEPGIYQITYSVNTPNAVFNFGNGSFGYGNFGSSGVADIGNDNARFKISSLFAGDAFYAVASSLTSVRSTDSSFYFDQALSIIYVHFANHDPPDVFNPRTIGIINGYSNKTAYYDDIFYDGRVISVPNFSREKDLLCLARL